MYIFQKFGQLCINGVKSEKKGKDDERFEKLEPIYQDSRIRLSLDSGS
jgi:hypothetical protein